MSKEKTKFGYIQHNNAFLINPIKKENSCLRLPDEYIIPPGFYNAGKHCLDMTHEGFYILYDMNGIQEQRVVVKENILLFVSSLIFNNTHGTKDKQISVQDFLNISKYRSTFMTCTPISRNVSKILNMVGIKSRPVLCLATDEIPGDCGHTMIEVFFASINKWVLIDPTRKTVFKDTEGNFMNMLELYLLARTPEFENVAIEQISTPPAMISLDQFPSLYSKLSCSDGHIKRAWYHRLFSGGISVIENDRFKCLFMETQDGSMNDYILSYSNNYSIIDCSRWISMFYGCS
ncbi:MAG: hypothetical protein ACOC3T_00370 [Bacteroidota bacterium]